MRLWLAALGVVAALVAAGPARGAYPGSNARIAFGRCEDATCATSHVWAMDANGGNAGPLINGPTFDTDPAYSPDGQRIAYQTCPPAGTSCGLAIANSNGAGVTPLTDASVNMQFDDQPAFSSDGKTIYFQRCVSGSCALWTIPSTGGTATQLTHPAPGFSDLREAVSPDGSKLVFQHCTSSPPCALDIMNSNGTGEVPFTTPTGSEQDDAPNFSPDGTRIVFVRDPGSGGTGLELAPVSNGAAPTPLTTPASGTEDNLPAFSPDGTQVVFDRIVGGGNAQVMLINAAGGPVQPLTGGGGAGDFKPDWQPGPPQLLSPPVLGGNLVNGQTLTATASQVIGGGPTSLAFLRCDASGNSCVPIPGASAGALAASYKLTSADIGHAIRVRQTVTAVPGTTTSDSAPSKAVAPSPKACSNVFAGTSRRDSFKGTSGGDRINGGRGNDKLSGAGGADCLSGGAGNDAISGGKGNDKLSGGAGKDRIVAGPGRNIVSGGSGNDRINVANRKRDRVSCGRGRDTVIADRIDKLSGCEHVKLRRR